LSIADSAKINADEASLKLPASDAAYTFFTAVFALDLIILLRSVLFAVTLILFFADLLFAKLFTSFV